MKRWKLPLAALILVLVGLVVLFFSRHRPEPDIGKPIARAARPKLTRPVRPNAPRSERAKKINAKTDTGARAAGGRSHSCLKRETYDEAARTLRREFDKNCDGTDLYCTVDELNDYGEPIRKTSYQRCGNTPSYCTTLEHDEYGEAIASHIDQDCDGRHVECSTGKYNDHGDIVESIIDKGCKGNSDGEGDQDYCFSYSYDEDGMIVSSAQGKCGEEPTLCTSYEYDLAAGVRRETWDSDCDGTPNFVWVKIFHEGAEEDDYDQFVDKGCTGNWYWCIIIGEDNFSWQRFEGNEACAKKYGELVKRNRERR